MKKPLLIMAIALALGGCDNSTTQEQADTSVQNTDTKSVQQKPVVEKPQLTSGIDMQYIDKTVRPRFSAAPRS